MPESPKAETKTPTHKTVLVVGRPGGGPNGTNGGICFYDGGHEVRALPGDVVEMPVRTAAGFIADGLATADVPEED